MKFLRGWTLTAILALAIALTSTTIAFQGGLSVEGTQAAIRFTARTSFVLFCLAFSASAVHRLWPGAWSRWQVANRRHLGVSFAASHAVHAAAIATFASLDPVQFQASTGLGMFVLGGLAYVFIALMVMTSFDATAAWLGPRVWRRLHWAGSYYICISFLVGFGKRIPLDAAYAVPVVILLAIVVLRAVSWSLSRAAVRSIA
jgi:sulfoxide reductase heme-binding subunit YedZ